MADKKIADLNEATTASDTDIFIVEDNANTKKMTKANLKATLGVTQAESDIDAVETSIGNRTYTEQNVVTNGESITDSIDKLDVDLASHKAESASKNNLGHVKLPENWLTPTLINDWVMISPSTFPVGCRKDAFGRVTLKGLIREGANGSACLILPVGYRPTQGVVTVGVKYLNNDDFSLVRFSVNTNGSISVSFNGSWAGDEYVSLDSISFYVD